ncbi:MAG: hypothetical protein JXP72_10570 [Coriobacteriia bacterium]|nr:hypothetical protein [Coriobacteriia bacterium]
MRRVLIIVPMLLLALVLPACAGEAAMPEEGPTAPSQDGAAAPGSAAPSVSDGSRQVLVLGRSVMTDWMAHWGGDASQPATWEGFTITFREIEGPPGIADSAAAAIAEAPAGSTALFKFCFVDFNGGDFAGELDTYLKYCARVADAAEAAGVRLIIGTALPKVAGETTQELVAEQREFGRRVEALAAERRAAGQDVAVLDLNALLADDDGALARRYAVSAGDSHLSDAAYDALDEVLLPLLSEAR